MGIESDQLVYDYLSRVGDLAQQRQLPSATRMRLVSGLRDEIDRRRAKVAGRQPGRRPPHPRPPRHAGRGRRGRGRRPAARRSRGPPPCPCSGSTGAGRRRRRGRRRTRPQGAAPERLRPVVPRPRPAEPRRLRRRACRPRRTSPALHELGDGGAQPDWWRVGAAAARSGSGEERAGVRRRCGDPRAAQAAAGRRTEAGRREAATDAGGRGGSRTPDAAVVDGGAGRAAGGCGCRCPGLRPRRAAAGATRSCCSPPRCWSRAPSSAPGSPWALGWLIAYASRRLTRAESKWAVMGLPGRGRRRRARLAVGPDGRPLGRPHRRRAT